MGQTDTARIESATASGSSHFDFCVPSHYVHVKMGFFLGTTEVTRGQWMQFLRSTNTVPGDLNYPVTNVPHDAAIKYCEWLSQINGITVRLPTEIEFEYALRGNCHVQETESSRERAIIMGGPWPVDAPELDDSWTGAVGLNSNVQEWCIDLWDDKLYEKRVSKLSRGNSFIYQGFDASAISSESPRVVRGASFRDIPANKHPALRRYKSSDSREDSLGFRVVVPITASLISRKGD
jgi:formylglycine-generating enzyme required for sulfatase activity